ncbi:hypothetical protein MACK_003091 [Theileria orientalis]|uniref:rRNA biogenesis protein RRP36 n=1 Tax=Theileria orientalis TaxID=68886 RepID=A0A976QXK0_THEOR|nr:hypothetical protein MACK_003091 [Theileria orientalis]
MNESKIVKKNKVKVKKGKSNEPVELPNNVSFNPYRNYKPPNTSGASKKRVARDPRFSDFSGKLNIDMFKKSYNFLDEMRNDEVKDIMAAIKINKRYGPDSVKGINALKKIEHLNIGSLDEAKRALDRYKTEKAQLEKNEELRELKKSLIKEEKEKIVTTGKKPYYFPDKKVKKLYKEIQKKKIEETMKSTAINYGPNRSIHKKLESKSRRKLPKERKHNIIPTFRDV